ncbi:MAG: transcriptional regulator [Deltaproteobacteria bacterium]|nr:transcriptional regulator [Deltaproteobacteria bacterium]
MRTQVEQKRAKRKGLVASRGIRGRQIGYLFSNLPISTERMGDLFRVSSKTVQRWKEGKFSPSHDDVLERLSRVIEVVELGRKVFTPDGLEEFVTTPLPAFGHKTAIQLMAEGDYDKVLGALADDHEGLGF